MNYLVTGGAGFIGSNFVRNLITKGYQDNHVFILDSLTYSGNLQNLDSVIDSPNLTFIQGDIRDSNLVSEIMSEVDVCVNFAAESHVDRSIVGPLETFETNTTGTLVLLEAARKVSLQKFIQVSTDEVYGSIASGEWTENSPLLPNSPYSASKAAADLLARSYYRTYGLNVNITRCTNNYGPFQYPEKIIPLFVTNILEGRKVPVYGNGLNVRDWLHVDDHCRAIELVIDNAPAGEIYNIAGGLEITNIELTERVLAALGADSNKIEFIPDRKGHDFRYSMSYDKIRENLGFIPMVDFGIGFQETIDWYRSNENWWKKLKSEDRQL
jgi:dTDP-glucose 4,6-dehydratase